VIAAARADGLLCCDIGGDRFAFRGSDVRHVERAEYMRPDRDGARLGTLRLGGQQVPVFALGEVLGSAGRATQARSDGHIAVTGDRSSLTGWWVDRIARVPQPGPADIAPLPSMLGVQAASWFEGLVWLGDQDAALLLSPHNLLTTAAPAHARDTTPMFARPAIGATNESEPVAIVFSTDVLPISATRRFALSGRQIAAVLQPAAPIRVPGCHGHVGGLTWWRRTAVPVIDFRASRDRQTAHARCLIAQCGPRQQGTLVAFAIDAEVTMCRPATDHRLLPEAECPPFASAVFDVNGEAVALVDLDALLMPASVDAIC
jgi:chemotaxis signal transduction protein